MTESIYQIPVFETLSSAWSKIYGAKRVIWTAFIITLLIILGLNLVITVSQFLLPNFITLMLQILSQFIIMLLQIGLFYLGIKRAADAAIEYPLLFRSFNPSIIGKLILLTILEFLVLLPGIIILMLPNIILLIMQDSAPFTSLSPIIPLFGLIGFIIIFYLAIRMILAFAFVVDKEMGAWHSIKLSFQSTRSNFWRIVIIFFFQSIIIGISIIPLGLGLIWTIPFSFILYGLIYKMLLLNANFLRGKISNSAIH